MARSDLSMLEALLGEEKLSDDERVAFGDMRKGLHFGYKKALTKSQHEWVERRYLAMELDANEPSENLVSSGRVRSTECSQVFDYERMPKPKFPPGRKS